MSDKIRVLGVGIDVVTHTEAVACATKWLHEDAGSARHIVTANPEMIMLAHDDPDVARILNDADLVVADGIGVVLAARVARTPLPERVAGIDLAMAILKNASNLDAGVFLLGAEPGVADEAAAKLRLRLPKLNIVGTHHGYFRPEEEGRIVQEIQKSGAALVLVALGVPRQEAWIARYGTETGAKVLIGVGGALDGYAGRARRAPRWTQKIGMEWAYRLLRQPSRIGRMRALPRFALHVLGTVGRRGG